MARRRSTRLRSPVRTQPPVRRGTRRRSAQPGPIAGLWLFLSALCGLTAVLVDSLTVIIVCLIGAAVGLIIGLVALFAPEKIGAVPARPANTQSGRSSGKSASEGSARQPAGTGDRAGGSAPCGCRAGRRCPGAAKCQCKRCIGRRKSGPASKPSGGVGDTFGPMRRVV